MAHFETEKFHAAYVKGNQIAQTGKVGAYQIADDLGFERDSNEWRAAVSGAAAFMFNGHTFPLSA